MKPAGKFHEQDEADIHVSESAKLQILRDIFTEIKKPLVFWEASPSNHNHGSALGPASATGDFYHANLLTSFAPKYESWPLFYIQDYKKLEKLCLRIKKERRFTPSYKTNNRIYKVCIVHVIIPTNSKAQTRIICIICYSCFDDSLSGSCVRKLFIRTMAVVRSCSAQTVSFTSECVCCRRPRGKTSRFQLTSIDSSTCAKSSRSSTRRSVPSTASRTCSTVSLLFSTCTLMLQSITDWLC